MKIKCIIKTPSSSHEIPDIDMVLLPCQHGQMGVLYKHMTMVAQVTPGTVYCHNGENVSRVDVDSGIALIDSDRVELFCTTFQL